VRRLEAAAEAWRRRAVGASTDVMRSRYLESEAHVRRIIERRCDEFVDETVT
jgi:hypothetical protein